MISFRTATIKTLCAAVLALPCSSVASGSVQEPSSRYLDVLHETFFIATPATRGMSHRLDWTEFRLRLSDAWLVKYTHLQMIDQGLLDETFVQYEQPSFAVRAGRLRSGFGFGDWSDLFYNVSARLPIVRLMPVLDSYSLLRFGSGIEVEGHSGGIEYRASATDSSLGQRQFEPDRLDALQARVQVPVSDLLLGLNLADIRRGALGGGGQVYGIDIQRRVQRWTMVGEVVGASGGDTTGRGYYADVSYRLTHPLRPNIGVRQEEYRSGLRGDSMLTAGIRIAPIKELAFNLNYGFRSPLRLMGGRDGSGGGGYDVVRGFDYASTLEGWSFQAMMTFRFRI